ncbi:MAG TPA: protein kinase [Terriglobales bacterium]|nr:protein kinase [Terriglobales bacterium]
MALISGTKLGPYEIQSPLGAGGMGEVYRARDTRLDRTVAVKILPSHLSSNPEAKQRFEREARAISSLNHPHICTLYDVGHQDGTDYLVMEFLEGESLADRLRKGPLPLQQVLKYGIEIGQGLEKAHRTGVIHRDLKPGNVMLTKSGAKLMDFGLAKATPPIAPSSSGLTMTQSTPVGAHPLTTQGTIVGTFQYMAPEQIEGKEADARSDVFAYGAVLYEMVTGKRAFEGKSQLSVASAILERDPAPISAASHGIPPALEKTIANCLTKDPEQRWSTAHDVMLQLTMIANTEDGASKPASGRLTNRIASAIALVALLVGGSIVALVNRWARPTPQSSPVIRFAISFPKDASMALPNPTSTLAIAPDGSAIAYVAALPPVQPGAGGNVSAPGPAEITDRAAAIGFSSRVLTGSQTVAPSTALFVRRMDRSAAELVPGGEAAINPFFSPDGQWLAWFSKGFMRKARLGGGAPVTVCEIGNIFMGGAYWGADGFIYFTPGDLMRVSANGGQPELLAKVDTTKDADYQSPQLLPGGKAVLLTRRPLNVTSYDDAVIFAYRLDTHESVTMVEGGSAGIYLPSGYLLYARGGSFFAMPFDAARLKPLGASVEVLHGGMLSENAGNITLAVSNNGVLAYAPGGPIHSDDSEVLAVSHSGTPNVLSPSPRIFDEPVVSPDGQNLAITVRAANDDIWLLNRARGVLTRFTFAGGDNQTAIWSGDGSHVIYSRSNRTRNLFWRPVNGAAEERLTSGDTTQFPDSTTPDGKLLAFTQWTGANADIYVLPLDGAHTPRPLIATRFNEQEGIFSPDGKWLAFVSNESGTDDVYVQPFGREGLRSVVSSGGGVRPMWSRDGKSLYYSAGDAVMQVAFDPVTGNVGHTTLAVRLPPRTAVFSVSPKGEFIGVRKVSEGLSTPELDIVTEWFRELRTQVPAPN